MVAAFSLWFPASSDCHLRDTHPCSQYWTTDIELADDTWRPGDPIDPDLDMSVLKAEDLEMRDKALAASLRKLGIADLHRQFIEVPRSSVVIANYDLIHRGTRKFPSEAPRYMFKFYFARTREPTEPAWHCTGNSPALDHVRDTSSTKSRNGENPARSRLWLATQIRRGTRGTR